MIRTRGCWAGSKNATYVINLIFFLFQDLHSPSISNEVDSLRDGSDNQDMPYRGPGTLCPGSSLFQNMSDLDVDFPPKPVSLSLTCP